MKILITGATGFLGRNLVNSLLSLNYEITVVGRNKNRLEEFFLKKNINKIETDYSLDSLLLITKGQDVIVHLASELMQRETDPLKISAFYGNSTLIENIAIASDQNEIAKLINISSISVYGQGINMNESMFLSPSNIYGVSKASIESYLSYFQKRSRTKIISLRLARLYGLGEREGLIFTDFINKAQQKEMLVVYGQGKSTIEYIYIKDAIDFIQLCLSSEVLSGVYNIGTGHSYSIKEIADSINNVFDNNGNIEFKTDKPDNLEGTIMDVSKVEVELGWKASWGLNKSLIDIKNIVNQKYNGDK